MILPALLATAACAACIVPASTASAAVDAAASTAPTGGASATGEARAAPAGARSRSHAAKTKAKVGGSGIATWYGPGLYGGETACGQTLTPALVGVANRTLPCGTLVRVDYHGQSLVVPVLDRGPYGGRASWDLTAGAAGALDITGTARIRTRVVGSERNTPTLGAPPVTAAETAAGGAEPH
jgi:rare lipoprotein A (peptidoglycan hydrolase)